jgi:hypothetical protein
VGRTQARRAGRKSRPAAWLGCPGRGEGRESWAGLETGKGKVGRFCFLFFQTLFELKHFQNSFQNFQIILKLFKTSHPHTKTM